MKRIRLRTLLIVVLFGSFLTACGNQTDLSTKPATSEPTAVDVTEYSSVSNGSNARGYGNQNALFLFVLAYLFAPAVL